MWSSDRRAVLRLLAVTGLGGLTAGCFQPMYGDPKVVASPGLDSKLATVQVAPINQPNGTRLSRVGVVVRDNLMSKLTHNGAADASTLYRLDIQLSASQQQVIVDINSGRPDIQNYGIDASYTLTELATKKPMFRATTFARVTYNIPGQQQRFAGERGLRDAENRAAETIADNIRNRLASFFVAGT